jgi:hypothetical protein
VYSTGGSKLMRWPEACSREDPDISACKMYYMLRVSKVPIN